MLGADYKCLKGKEGKEFAASKTINELLDITGATEENLKKALIKRNIRFTKDLERLPVAGGPGKKRKLSAATAVWRKI